MNKRNLTNQDEIPDLPEEIMRLKIPDDELGRQAVDSLRGYIYQIYQTLNAWLTLKEDEILLLEVAEDYAVIAEDALKATQVKDTANSGSVTLKTESVAGTIESLWNFQQANPDIKVSITYLTTSKIGKEKRLTFPNDHSGLTYWCVAAREGADIDPIRQVLLDLDLSPQLKDFIKSATPDILRERILLQIDWVCGEKDIEALDQAIRDRLVYFGDQRGYTPTDSEKARDSLIAAILKKIVQKNNRQLSRVDFLRIFENAVSISLPMSQVREFIKSSLAMNQTSSVGRISAADFVLNAAQIPLLPPISDRHELVEKLLSDARPLGTLWLYGSSGTGKTLLTQFIARQSKYNWSFVRLRDCSPLELEFRLRRMIQTLHSDKVGGVILDDFPTEYAHTIRLVLTMFVSEVYRMGGYVIVTSTKSPSPNLRNCFGENGPYVFNVPYLSREEVAEITKLAGGDSKKWAGVIHVFSGGGHPQLVQARISGLQQRNWPDSELVAGIPGIGISAKEIEEERDSIRERLLAELLPDTHELLCRLTLFVGYFDRELAIAIGEVEPAINRPGGELDVLLGPWVELVANDRFRISPLVSDIGTQTLGKTIQIEVSKRIVDHLIKRHPFPGDFLGTFLSHALASRHAQGLAWLTMAILHTPDHDRRMLAEHLFILPLLKTDQLIFKENIHLSAMLRLAQFRVAVWANETEYLPAIAGQLIKETRMIDNKEIADGFLCLVISSILMELSLKISPSKWMPLIEELEQHLNGQGELIEYIRELDIAKKGLNDWSIPQFLFVIRTDSAQSINDLVELFTILDSLEENRRIILLTSLDRIPNGKRLMIDSAWLAEMTAGTLNGADAAEKYRQLAETAEVWGDKDIAVECECARAVMLDEYMGDFKGALDSLEKAEKKYPENVRLLRGHAKVYYRKGDHVTALKMIEEIADAIPESSHIERVFALREAGISAAETGDFVKASQFFSGAFEAASATTDNMRPMAIGLKGDQAFAEFKLGENEEALNLVRQAILDAEQLNPEAGKKEKYCILVLGHLTLWMQKQLENYPVSEPNVPIVIGCCSNPEPPEDIIKMTCPPFLVLWYQLALLEVMMGINSGIMDELEKRTCAQKILSYELMLNSYLMVRYIVTVDIMNFFSYLPEYVSKVAYRGNNTSKIDGNNIFELTDADLSVIKPADWTSELYLQYAKDAILAIVTTALCSNDKDIKKELLSWADMNQTVSVALHEFISCFDKTTCSESNICDVTAFHLGYMMDAKTKNPDEIFLTTYRLWQYLLQTYFKDSVEDMTANYLTQCWQEIIANQRFLLKQPMTAVPAIETAIGESTSGTIKIAKIILAAEMAVGYNFNENQRSELKEHCD